MTIHILKVLPEYFQALADGTKTFEVRRNYRAYQMGDILHKRHSPSGFEWGYEGSGPADLALAILLAVTGDEKLADHLYQQFKRDVIARVPRDGAVIKRVTIEEWIRKHSA